MTWIVDKHPITILSETHVISILVFVARNSGCMKKEIYANESNSCLVSEKVLLLEKNGLVSQRKNANIRNSLIIEITPLGKEIADQFIGIEKLLHRVPSKKGNVNTF